MDDDAQSIIYYHLRVSDLKQILHTCKLTGTGRKKDLMDRVFTAYKSKPEIVMDAIKQVYKVEPNMKRLTKPSYSIYKGLVDLSGSPALFNPRTFYEITADLTPILELVDMKCRIVRLNITPPRALLSNEEIHIRFCERNKNDTNTDICPYLYCLIINGKRFPNKLNYEYYKKKKMKQHINLTELIGKAKNIDVEFEWFTDIEDQSFCLKIEIVKPLKVSYVMSKIPKISNSTTEKLIQTHLKCDMNNSEIATTSMRVSLICPLGKIRLRTPGKGQNCTHIQCFDLELYLEMNNKRPAWKCPVCNIRTEFSSLVVDSLFEQILSTTTSDEIIFDDDLTWKPLLASDSEELVSDNVKQMDTDMQDISVIDLTESDDETSSATEKTIDKWLSKAKASDVITISDSPLPNLPKTYFKYGL